MTSLELQRAHLLQHVLSHSRDLPAALENTALRGESLHMRRLLAHGACHGTLSLEELRRSVLQGGLSPYSLHAEWLARLASVCALQRSGEAVAESADDEFALAALQLANPQLPPGEFSRRMLKLQAELLHETGRFRELDALLAARPELRLHYYGYLETDSRSPYARSGSGTLSEDEWLEAFNQQFTDRGLLPVRLRRGAEVPFNRLEAAERATAAHDDGGPLVSVVMTTYRPVREDVLQSARSILAQTWRRLELLIIDDASSQEYSSVLDELEALDERVRLTRLKTNGGTYRARNVGISQARGALITGQDADDWSHPQRIEIQAHDLLEHPERPGNQVYTVNMTEDLVRIRRGYPPFIPSAPTLMVRSSILDEVGGYLPARKAADNELRGRVAAYTGRPVEALREPLIFMRILPDSLSRADFRPGWQHPARRAFWSAYRTWHDHTPTGGLRLGGGEETPVHVPSRFTTPPEQPQRSDVVLAADWCEDGRLQADMMEEIRVLRESGRSVGVLHLESALHPALRARRFHRPLQELINSGEVQQVIPDEAFHEVGLMLVRSPELLQFLPQGRCAFGPEQVAVTAERPSVEPGGRVTYLPEDCDRHSEAFFGRRPVWAPSSPEVRKALGAAAVTLSPEDSLTPFSMASVSMAPSGTSRFSAPRTGAARRLRRTGRPVIGAWGGTLPAEWPARRSQIRSLLPTDGSADVRLYGDPALPAALLGEPAPPPAWMALPPRSSASGRRTFLRSVDFFLSFPQPGDPVLRRPVLEALAAGCVVVLPPWMEPACGEAAVYARPDQVPEVIHALAADPRGWAEQSRRAAAFRADAVGGPGDFLRMIDRLTAGETLAEVPQRQEMMSG